MPRSNRLDDCQNDINSQLQSAWDARELKGESRERVAREPSNYCADDAAERLILAAGLTTASLECEAEADRARLKRFAAVKELRSNNARIRRWLGR